MHMPEKENAPRLATDTPPMVSCLRSDVLIVGVLFLAVFARLAVALYLGDVVNAPPLMTDQRSYHVLAVRLVEGYGFSFPVGWYPFTPPNTPTAHWSYLYSLFVAAVYALAGPHVLVARLVQAVLAGILLPWAVYRLAQRIFPERPDAAIWALILTACYAYFILYAATLMTESFYIVCVVWSLTLALDMEAALRRGQPVPRHLPWVFGLSLGLGALLRQSILPWVPVLFLYLAWRGWRGREAGKRITDVRRWLEVLRPLCIAGLVLVACILPFTVRNYVVYGEFLLLNSNTGYAMYSAQHPMHGDRFREFDAAPLPEDLRHAGLNEAQLDRILLRRGIQFILDDPIRYMRLSLSRLRAYFSLLPGENTTPLHAVGRFISFGAYLPLWLYGLYLALRIPALRARLGLPVLFAAFYTAMHVLTWAMVRYRLPVDAVAMPLAALAAEDLWHRGRRLLRQLKS